MAYKLIEANIETDLDTFTNLLNSNRTKKVTRRRFEWLYLENPHGKARAWFIIDDKMDKPIAFTSVLPRLMKVANKTITCWNCCDFSVEKKYRTLGIALKLRRQAKVCVDNAETQALYAHPNDRMKVVHAKAGHHCIGKMQRYVKLLSVRKQITKRFNNQIVTHIIAPVIDRVYTSAKTSVKVKPPFSVEIFDNTEFNEEFDDFFNMVAANYGIIGQRSSDYLNWRYARNPLYQTQRFVLRKADALYGYIIFLIKADVAVCNDILCMQDATTVNLLLLAWIAKMRQAKIGSISVTVMDQNPMIPFLKKNGFRIRPDESSVYAYANIKNGLHKEWLDGKNWYMTVGDRDV